MNDTPTPRSDAAELTEPYEIRALGFCVVHIDDARQLERELAKAIAALSAIEERYIDGCDTYEDWRFMGITAREFFFPPNA